MKKRTSGTFRFITLLLAAVLLAASVPVPVSAVTPGTPIGWVLYSNVVAYIDGFPIRSYNISGNTYIVAEDLMEYGFSVTWEARTSRLIISTARTAQPYDYTAAYVPTMNTHTPGTPAMQYLYTNVTVWIGSSRIEGYNIGGYTCIAMDDLAEYFGTDYVWNPNDSSLRLRTTYQDSPGARSLTPLDERYYWGYRFLAENGSDAYVWAYERIRDGIAAMQEKIELNNARYSFSPEAVAQIYQCVRSDHPEFFWWGSSYRYTYRGNVVISLTPNYLCTKSEMPALRAEFERSAQRLLEGVEPWMSDYDKEIIVHDNLVRYVTYDSTKSDTWTRSAYGAIVNGWCVCDGYTRAFQYLMYQCGIETIYVSGKSNKDVEHSWNIVNIDGAYYYIDVTWDDPTSDESRLCYTYFNVPGSYIRIDHTPSTNTYSLPECVTWENNYYNRNGYVAYLTLDSICSVLRKQYRRGEYYEIYIYPDGVVGDEDDAFCRENVNELCRVLRELYGIDRSYKVLLWHHTSNNGRILSLKLTWE